MATKSKGYMSHNRGTHLFDAIAIGDKLIPSTVGFAAATDGANATLVTLTVQNKEGGTIAGLHQLTIYLSDSATGVGLTGTSASGAVQAKSASTGFDLAALTAKKALKVITKSDGTYQLSITDSAKTQFYVCAVVPCISQVVVAGRVLTASYA